MLKCLNGLCATRRGRDPGPSKAASLRGFWGSWKERTRHPQALSWAACGRKGGSLLGGPGPPAAPQELGNFRKKVLRPPPPEGQLCGPGRNRGAGCGPERVPSALRPRGLCRRLASGRCPRSRAGGRGSPAPRVHAGGRAAFQFAEPPRAGFCGVRTFLARANAPRAVQGWEGGGGISLSARDRRPGEPLGLVGPALPPSWFSSVHQGQFNME